MATELLIARIAPSWRAPNSSVHAAVVIAPDDPKPAPNPTKNKQAKIGSGRIKNASPRRRRRPHAEQPHGTEAVYPRAGGQRARGTHNGEGEKSGRNTASLQPRSSPASLRKR